jgi:hypothetical protein
MNLNPLTLDFGIWNLEFGIWNLESGIWNLESINFYGTKFTTSA